MINRAQFLAGVIDQNVAQGGYVDGMLLGLDALPDDTSASLRQRALPLEASAENALDGVWRKWSTQPGRAQASPATWRSHGRRLLARRHPRPHRLRRQDGACSGRCFRPPKHWLTRSKPQYRGV